MADAAPKDKCTKSFFLKKSWHDYDLAFDWILKSYCIYVFWKWKHKVCVHNYVLKWAQYFSGDCNTGKIWINQEMLLFSISSICIFKPTNNVASPPLVCPDCSGEHVRLSRSFLLPLVLLQYLQLQVATIFWHRKGDLEPEKWPCNLISSWLI